MPHNFGHDGGYLEMSRMVSLDSESHIGRVFEDDYGIQRYVALNCVCRKSNPIAW